MSKPRLTAPQFSTITDADWCREIQAARQRGRDDGNALLAKIRAAVAAAKCVNGAITPDALREVATDLRGMRRKDEANTLQMRDAKPAKQKATDGAGNVAKSSP